MTVLFKKLLFGIIVFFVLGIGYSHENTDRSYADFVDGIVNGRLRSSVGVSITDILMIGVGGSNLGPKLVCKALRETKSTHLRVKFLDHLDGREFDKLKNLLKPESTFCVIASKSFTTSGIVLNTPAEPFI